jgi:hypothetical protein
MADAADQMALTAEPLLPVSNLAWIAGVSLRRYPCKG